MIIQFLNDESGVTAIEYGLLGALVGKELVRIVRPWFGCEVRSVIKGSIKVPFTTLLHAKLSSAGIDFDS
jgi:Flp pilus assembly pilin Flp